MGKEKDVTPKKAVVIIAYCKDGLSYRKISEKLNVSKASVGKGIKQYRESGSFQSRMGSGRPRKKLHCISVEEANGLATAIRLTALLSRRLVFGHYAT